MNWTYPSRRRRPQPPGARHDGRPRASIRNTAHHENFSVRRIAPLCGLRSRRRRAGRCGAERSGVLCSGRGAQRLARAWIPREAPFLELLLLGWVGVALGRLTIRRDSSAAQHSGQETRRREAAAKEEKVDRILRQVAKVLQAQVTDSESFSERLDGASERLSRQEAAGPIRDIVLALVEDNRDMRDRLDNVRNQLEESRLQVVQLQTNLERAEEAGLRDVVTASAK